MADTSDLNTIEQEGWDAYCSFIERVDNPYIGSPLNYEWDYGWRMAQKYHDYISYRKELDKEVSVANNEH